jgi:hypothetical protein
MELRDPLRITQPRGNVDGDQHVAVFGLRRIKVDFPGDVRRDGAEDRPRSMRSQKRKLDPALDRRQIIFERL